MLYFRRICLLVTLALTFGASELFAQTPASPTGISVRIVSPADSAWVGIDDKIVVEVVSSYVLNGKSAENNTDLTFLTTDIERVGLWQDAATLGRFDGTGNDGDTVFCHIGSITPTMPASPTSNNRSVVWDGDVCKVTGIIVRWGSANQHVARYTFELKAYNYAPWLAGISGVFAVARSNVGTEGLREVSNVNRGGDGKFLQVDLGRPVQTASVLTEVGISADDDGTVDVNEDANDIGADDKRKFKIGDTLKLTAKVNSLLGTGGAVAVKLGLFAFNDAYVDAYMANPDSALAITEFKIGDDGRIAGALRSQQLGSVQVLQHSVKVEEGGFKVLGDGPDADTDKDDILMDDLRVKVAAFLVDRAGNIGASAAFVDLNTDAAAGAPFSGDNTVIYRVDSKKPKITIKYPVDHPDSNRFTGLREGMFRNYRDNDGSGDNDLVVPFKPLELKVDEDLTSLVAVAKAGNKTDRDTITADYTDVGNFEKIPTSGNNVFPNVASKTNSKGGKKINLTIEATDEVGNKATKTVNNVWHDQDVPNPIRRFPSVAALGNNPTINNETRHPVLRFNESLDSLSVRFIEDTTTNPRNAIQKAGNNLLTMVNKDITITVDSSLVHGTSYWFQVFARDLAGNVDITPAEEFTFSTSFKNPQADSFKVVATSGDTAIAGYQLPIEITALNAMSTRSANADRVAVTYRSGDVRVKAMMADGSDASSVVISGTGVAKDEGGYYSLSSAAWNTGVYRIKIKSNKVLNGLKVVVEETETTTVDGESTTTVEFSNTLGDITIDEGDMRRFVVTAWEGDGEAGTVSGEFKVRVVPADSLGNPSVKYGEELTGGANIGTPGLFDVAKPSKLTSIDVEFSASHPSARCAARFADGEARRHFLHGYRPQ